ncbi:DNA polymerase III subunit epsilon [Corynebacterium aquatimens]|uniref:DNA polymerase-3 subunit epsilon n=1 Tax=Corynebacterium aquatimens TaxID=1190508 RepID=A0A931E3N2_9CORY|nr:DNA polymerase III subunit epsilon [Corynebacterium aquatimens]MBG6122561.1 DNA polymerase-3 subunit epsilon [Corynebacterium aquatimens]WJY64899.1 DNA polymerase III subunit epsilon [Corynebacterium aquatimens]
MVSAIDYPFVAVYLQATGIHPSSGHLLTLDAVAFDAEGNVGEDFHAVFNPVTDPGPLHNHGVPRSDFCQAPRFSRSLKKLDKLIDGRTLILHDAPTSWGFIVAEARRAMNAAARANRKRNGRRRQRVGHVPTPKVIVDTLASARLQGVIPVDQRLEAVARDSGLTVEPPTASAERAARAEEETSRSRTHTLIELYRCLAASGELATRSPEELAPDRFGLQRARIRVDAHKASPEVDNPGPYSPVTGLKPGMEVVITDDVQTCHDDLIQAALDAQLTYSEKVTRETSLVVTNASDPAALRGKAMHAQRKEIPLLTDSQFTAAVAAVSDPAH